MTAIQQLTLEMDIYTKNWGMRESGAFVVCVAKYLLGKKK